RAAVQAAVASDYHVVAQAMYDDATTDVRPDLAAITAQVMLLYPWDSTMGIPQPNADALYRGGYVALSGMRFQRIDGAYNFLMIDQPDAFQRAVDDFLR